jgi:hypothetical protein
VLAFFGRAGRPYTDRSCASPIGVFGAMAANVSHGRRRSGDLRGWPAVFSLLRDTACWSRASTWRWLPALFVFIPVMVVARIPIAGFSR